MRVKFFNANDLSGGHMLNAAAQIIANFNPSRKRYRINDVLEFYNVAQFIENQMYLKNWQPAEKARFYAAKPALYRAIALFFESIDKRNASRKLKGVDAEYVGDFLVLFMKYKLYSTAGQRQFGNILKANSIGVALLLRNEAIVKQYPDFICSLLLSQPKNAELVLGKHLARNDRSDRTIYFPATLTNDEKLGLLDSYIESDSPNLNYLRLISESHSDEGLRIPDAMKLKASRKSKVAADKIFDKNSGIPFGYEVSFSDSQSEDRVISSSKDVTHVSFKKSWFQDNLDFPTILNNFIFPFEYADRFMMIALLSFKANLGIVDRFMGVPSKTEYKTGAAFDGMEMLSDIEIALFYGFLLQNKIRLEEVIEWFFATNIPEQFGVNGFQVKMPSESATYREKCHLVFPAMEGFLKQYRIYVSEGQIDPDLVQISSEQTSYADLPSLSDKKYVYVREGNNEISTIMYLMFSDQSSLGYVSESKNEDTFFDLLQRNTVKLAELEPYHIEGINFLKDVRIIKVINGKLAYRSTPQIEALHYLFHQEAMNYARMPESIRKEIDLMVKKGYLNIGNTLLSKGEADYFNYYLNKKEFSNGLDLRNIYAHGTPPTSEDSNAAVYQQHYITGLKLVILLLIKLNDEFCLRDEKAVNS